MLSTCAKCDESRDKWKSCYNFSDEISFLKTLFVRFVYVDYEQLYVLNFLEVVVQDDCLSELRIEAVSNHFRLADFSPDRMRLVFFQK